MRRARVRSERDLGLAFLDTLASEFSASDLMVAQLIIAADRVVFLARASSLDSWLVSRVGVVEEMTRTERWVDEAAVLADLEEMLARACGQLAKEWAKREAEEEIGMPSAAADIQAFRHLADSRTSHRCGHRGGRRNGGDRGAELSGDQ